MKVLHLQLTGNPGGIVSLCRDIANNSDNDNIIYFLLDGGTVADAIKKDGHQVEISYTDKKHWIKSARKFYSFCMDNKIDVIVNHSNCPIAIFHAAYVKRRDNHIKWIMYVHSSPEDLSTKHKILYAPFIKYQIKHSDARITISEFVKKSASKVFKVDEKLLDVVYNGVDISKYQIKDLSSSNSNKVRFIYVGRLLPYKGVHVLIEALSQLKDATNIQVDIVGEGPQRAELEQQVEKYGMSEWVTFHGLRMDVPDLLRNADFFVHPAVWNEGFGIALIEAMSVGLPCIAFKRGAIPEIINDGENGFIIDGIDSKKLADKIKKCAEIRGSDEYRVMMKNAVSTAEKFSIRNMVDKLEAIMERC